MKFNLITLLFLAATSLLSENILTFNKVLFERFVTDKKPGATLVSKKSADNLYTFTSNRTSGVTSIIIKTAKEITPNVNYYFSFNYTLETINENSTLIIRYRFFDKSGKKLFEQWSSKQALGSSNENSYMGTIRYKQASTVEITTYFRGIYNLKASDFNFSNQTPVSKDGNFIFNGSFENNSMFEFYPQFRVNGKLATKEMSKKFTCERSLLKASSGKYSLYCVSPQPKSGVLINMTTLRLEGIQKYQFSVNCYYELATASSKVSASIGFKDANGKLIKYRFPSITKTQGKWTLLKDEFYPPQNAASIFVLFWVNGESKVYLDDFYFGPVKKLTPKKVSTSPATKKAASAIMLENNSNFALWCDRPFNKPKYQGLPNNFKVGKFYQLECAANESEPFTIVVNAKKKIADAKLKIADFKGPNGLIPASAITIKTIGYVNLKNPENPSIKGLIADPLLPENGGNITTNSNLGFFVDIKVPANQKAGLYTSNFSILSNNKVIAQIPVKLQVRAFQLPTISSFRSWFYAWATQPNYLKQDSRNSSVIWDDFCQQFKEHRFTGNQAMHPPKLTTKIKDGKLTITNWEQFDATIEKWRTKYNFRCFPIIPFNFLGHYHGWINEKGQTVTTPGKSPFTNSSWISKESLKRVQEFAKAYQDHVEKRFPDCDFLAYLFDEPLPDAQANLTKITSAISSAAPKMKIFITKEVTPSLTGVNFWCHPFGPGVYDAKKVDKAIAQGHGIWYYNWVVGIDDQQYIEARLYPWRIYTAKGTGGLLWQTVDCPKNMNIWDNLDKTHKCGGATIFYPPRKGIANDKIIPSLRSKHIKEGIDDFDYMTILQNKIDAKYPNLGRNRIMEILSSLFSNPPFVYDNNQELLYFLRKQIGDEIESFDKIPAVILSLPKANSTTELTSVTLEINAPKDTIIKVKNKTYTQINPNKKLFLKVNLPKLGLNEITIQLTYKGKTVTYKRYYTLQKDKNLDRLASLNKVAKNPKVTLHLKKFVSNSNYSIQDRVKTLNYLNLLEKSQLKKAIQSLGQGTNPLAASLIALAKESYKFNCFDRTIKLLTQARKINSIKNLNTYNVKVTPTTFKTLPAFTVDNGIIQYSFTLMGGRIYSFKVKGIECLNPCSFNGILNTKQRLGEFIPIELYKHSIDFGGFGDENDCGRYQATLLDWEIEFVELTPNKVSIALSSKMTEKKYFKIKRIMTLAKGSNQLVMNYTISNLLSPSAAKSDDPNSYEWPWRGRFVPAIGKDGKVNDEIIIPNPGEYKLPVTLYNPSKPVRYERKNFPLSKNWMGTRDKNSGTGIVVLGDKNITHGYIWFDSVNKNGNYTLEFPRSTYGKTIYDKVPNSPFLIQPGCEANFKLILKGIYNSKDVQDFENQATK